MHDAEFWGVIAVALLIVLGINVLICWRLHVCYAALPPQYRRLQPAMVWFLLIPCVPIVFNFFVYPGLSKSYKAYFDDAQPGEPIDTANGLATAYPILSLLSFIPYIGSCVAIAGLIVLIMFLVRMNSLKNMISEIDVSTFD